MKPFSRVRAIRALVCLCVPVLLARGVSAQDSSSGPPLVAYRLADGESVDLNGRLDDPVWSRASAITDFRQQEPVEGGTPSHETSVRVVYDSDNLYIGVMLYDDPERIIANQRERDAFLFSDDRFAWVLDTFQDGRTGYSFEVNPAGAMVDGLLTGSGGGGGGGGGFGGVNRSWDGIWEARTATLEDGWSTEIRIPFRTLNFDSSSDTWGINFERTISRNREDILWRGWRRTEGLNRLINAGELTGLEGLSQGIGLEAVASGIAGWTNTPALDDATEFPADVSLDLNYSVTPSLRASVSINTDFAEVESDQRRVNLTRFPLRFPEQRDFFLEGSSVFAFAPRSGPEPFFSRRIGLVAGEPIPINLGGRLTGQVGSTEIGFYQMRTGSHDFADGLGSSIPSEDFTVARLRQQIFEQSTIGAIYTRRATSADSLGISLPDRHTFGADLSLNTRRFLGDKNLELEAFFVWNSDPAPDSSPGPAINAPSLGDLTARGFRLNYPNDIWSGHLSYREFGDDYSPAVGFVSRNGFRRIEPRVAWSPRPSIDLIRSFEFSVQYRALWGLTTGILEERQWQLKPLEIDFESGDNINFQVVQLYEYLDGAFEISDDIFVQPGEYSNWEYQLQARTASRRVVSVRGGVELGGFWDGNRQRYDVNMTLRPIPGLNLTGAFETNDVSLSDGDFTTNLYRFEGSLDPSPWVSFTSQIQFDNVSETLGLFARFRWIITPGNDVFLVYTHNWRDFGDDPMVDDPSETGFQTLSRGATIKLNYTYRF
ncbi:MAG: DUF5916 domain-containing protein [Gemmatimonadota bacterium]|nr:DUF5916 domain-containing protein [Gemmatimonadota bacterium]